MKNRENKSGRLRNRRNRQEWLMFSFSASLFALPVASAAQMRTAQTRTAQTPTAQARAARNNYSRAVELVKLAEAAFLRGDYNRALVLCRQARATDARYLRTYTWMGAAHEKRGEVAQAREGLWAHSGAGATQQRRDLRPHAPEPFAVERSACAGCNLIIASAQPTNRLRHLAQLYHSAAHKSLRFLAHQPPRM
jgi:hypothetical protein